ncbi:MAG: flagellar biosynthesis protein FlgB [Litoreibacter sp.]|nr:flagellar biosynthesis protein FlgB [Litoreibacter sp.]
MFTSLDVFQSAQSMARHAAKQQSVVATNIAHVNTPNFKAMTLPDRVVEGEGMAMRARSSGMREQHFDLAGSTQVPDAVIDENAQMSPNGNSVSLEGEMLKSIEAERSHKRAMTVYQSALTILRTSIGR